MDNLTLPAFPIPHHLTPDGAGGFAPILGFTKLEYAALMIAQGLYASYKDPGDDFIVSKSTRVAARIIEEANK